MTVAPVALVHSAVKLAGHVIEGGDVSRTVTVNEQVLVFGGAAWSLAVQVTVVDPIENVVPEAGAQLAVGLASQASCAATVKPTTAPLGSVHSTGPMFPGHTVNTGGVVSTTVTVNEQVLVFGTVA